MNQTISNWRIEAERYISGGCSPEEAAQWEELMLSNDNVLEVYMQVLSEMDQELPVIEKPEEFADRILANEEIIPYPTKVVSLSSDRPRKWYEKSIFHYTVAASITLVFMFSGAFDRLFPEDAGHKASMPASPSYSEQLMEHTTSWLDKILGR